MIQRTFEVTLELLVRQKVEVRAQDEDTACDIALHTYDLIGAVAHTEVVLECEELTAYREHA